MKKREERKKESDDKRLWTTTCIHGDECLWMALVASDASEISQAPP